ncbi:Uncharacterized protein dnm_081660 [Desulfonema magnum]|uniref:Uncharacterized protein n=1 Tax=Desulfonema magnum TaxID=45655 RepID=A0A975BUN7_9BACT|nr:Uncharacterized protein dnm_081660 [Desulfonema magnum]
MCLRKSIFRTPEKIPKNPLTLNSTVLGAWRGAANLLLQICRSRGA